MNSTVADSPYDDVLCGTLYLNGRIAAEIGPDADDSSPVLIGRDPRCHVELSDERVSAVHLELARTTRGVRIIDRSRNGVVVTGDVYTHGGESFLRGRCVIRCGSTRLEFVPAETTTRVQRGSSDPTYPLVGEATTMRPVFELIRKVAPLELTTLIRGETGTGKELVAKAIHLASPRAKKRCVVIDCGGIPTSLAESILFGHKRGSFTDAHEDRVSPFLEADGGTVFLDEIGELAPQVQTKLLRVLAEREVQAVGSSEIRSFNVRIIAATRRELELQVGGDDEDNGGRRKTFRSDLYFRLANVRVCLPPLRERITDIRVLVDYFARGLGMDRPLDRVTPDEMARLERHDWPGNVRELRNVVTTAVGFASDGGMLEFGPHMHETGKRNAGRRPLETFHEMERRYLEEADRRCAGNQSEMSRVSGIPRGTLRERLKRHGLLPE